jgi:hypothetical protein
LNFQFLLVDCKRFIALLFKLVNQQNQGNEFCDQHYDKKLKEVVSDEHKHHHWISCPGLYVIIEPSKNQDKVKEQQDEFTNCDNEEDEVEDD